MPDRIYNFSPGPATLPVEVLQQAAKDIVNYNNKGIGLIEMSHRSKDFMAITEEAENLIRELLNVPQNYKVLFLQGGASTQFAMVPMNLLGPGKKGSYLNTGTWAKKAIKEANIVATAHVAYSSEGTKFDHVPTDGDYTVDPDAEYLYFVSNNTIYGTQFQTMPKSEKMLVCDMSSDIMSRPFDITPFGLVFAGAQKNMGPAGATLVIVREDLLDRVAETVPTMFRYKTHAEKGSMFNTPPCFALYTIGLVCKWLKKIGGVPAIEKINREKAAILYEAIDSTDFYRGHAKKDSRSLMNVTFNLPTPELEAKFIQEGTKRGLDGLKGHRSIGGIRASIYNAFPKQGVIDLVAFMQEFAKTA
ncbi:MAG: 3-phosphoserine/phosphohydroxythreonine transaminase [Proteobacteria bacterium]|nr:3-phosphoserine/phosphohydroxythreonine transaminase [Pseudomonadota bacterium]MBU4298281.1 3-phosphoserine/phosphohydroxythreonine transaminase [Pseudomonadota bacterium]MCG2747550.1 3-phosphoserine/phosphohydroxythreonine transaminase [Desulfobulbaceae bacterium]